MEAAAYSPYAKYDPSVLTYRPAGPRTASEETTVAPKRHGSSAADEKKAENGGGPHASSGGLQGKGGEGSGRGATATVEVDDSSRASEFVAVEKPRDSASSMADAKSPHAMQDELRAKLAVQFAERNTATDHAVENRAPDMADRIASLHDDIGDIGREQRELRDRMVRVGESVERVNKRLLHPDDVTTLVTTQLSMAQRIETLDRNVAAIKAEFADLRTRLVEEAAETRSRAETGLAEIKALLNRALGVNREE